MIGVTEDRAKNRQGDSMAIDGTQGNRARLYRWQVCKRRAMSAGETSISSIYINDKAGLGSNRHECTGLILLSATGDI